MRTLFGRFCPAVCDRAHRPKHSAEKVLYPLVVALGVGPIFQVRLLLNLGLWRSVLNQSLGSAYWPASCNANEGHGYRYSHV